MSGVVAANEFRNLCSRNIRGLADIMIMRKIAVYQDVATGVFKLESVCHYLPNTIKKVETVLSRLPSELYAAAGTDAVSVPPDKV
jgi:hypothetical protein